MRRVAVLDLGTNTFNLLIAEQVNNEKYTILFSEKYPVKLGEGGINKGEITATAISRAHKAISYYHTQIINYKVSKIKAYGTSAFRTAENGLAFMSEVKKKYQIDIEIISGDKEAELIYLGVRQTLLLTNHKFLILDIGGGSNELILADMHRMYWKKSYPLGIARLLEKFTPSDPLTPNETEAISNYLESELSDLFSILKEYNIQTLVGASGSFETFVHMIKESEVIETEGETEGVCNEIPLAQYFELHQKLITSSFAQRTKMKGLEPMRIEMIVLASLFVNTLLKKHSFNTLYQSNFALKEGAVLEILNNTNQ